MQTPIGKVVAGFDGWRIQRDQTDDEKLEEVKHFELKESWSTLKVMVGNEGAGEFTHCNHFQPGRSRVGYECLQHLCR